MACRGRLEIEDNEIEGLSILMYLDCAKDDRIRFGLWFTPTPEEGADLFGTPAALEGFLEHFEVCR